MLSQLNVKGRTLGKIAATTAAIMCVTMCVTTAVHGDETCEPDWDDIFSPGVGIFGSVWALGVYEDDLIAAGSFSTIGGVSANNIARWDGTTWHPLGEGLSELVHDVAVYDGELIAGGEFGVERFDGSAWHPLGGGISDETQNNTVRALAEFNGKLYVGGHFKEIGDLVARQIASWDGSSWKSPEDGVGSGGYVVHALTVYGGNLIVGGTFPRVGTMNGSGCWHVNRIAAWSGSGWSPVGSGCGEQCGPGSFPECGFSQGVFELGMHEGTLIAVGAFVAAQGETVRGVAQFFSDPNAWYGFNEGCPAQSGCGITGPWNRTVEAVTSYNGRLYIGGIFDTAGGVPVENIASGDGVNYESVGGGVDGSVRALLEYDGMLIVGGGFDNTGDVQSKGIVAWRDCTEQEPTPGDLNGDGAVDGLDLLILLSAWGTCADPTPGNCPADLNGDGTVDGLDLLILLSNWG